MLLRLAGVLYFRGCQEELSGEVDATQKYCNKV